VFGLSDELKRKHASATLGFAPPCVDVGQMAAECQLAITNANHTTTGRFLLSGKPMMLIPLQLEQELLASAVERIGAGVVVCPKEPKDFCVRLQTLLKESAFQTAAERLAAKYADGNPNQVESILEALEESIDDGRL
jgi:UDP:flavonoid glycosyltransferase YjiC (YdhE family)